MYIYGDKYRPVRAWNAVNVPDSEGFLRHGNVISAVDGGLIVDFDCPSQRSEYVEYGKIFNPAAFPFPIKRTEIVNVYPWFSKFTKNGDIQVLLRIRPDQPWTWLPGKLLECDFCCPDRDLDYAFVEVQMAGDTFGELVPETQVRVPLTAADLGKQVIGNKHFVMRSCSLPKNYWTSISSVLSSLFGRDLENLYKVLIVSVFSDRLTYLQRLPEKPIQHEELEQVFNKSKIEITSYEESGQEYPNMDWICRRTLTKTDRKQSRRFRTALGSKLTVELVVEVFQCLDTIDRLRCRRTCKLWNTVLDSQTIFTDVRVSFGEASFSASPDYESDPFYAVIGGLLKCINNHTQRIVITDMGMHASTDDVMDLINPLMESVRMKQLIFYNSEFCTDFCENMEVAMRFIVKNCDRFDVLTFKNCTFPFELEGNRFDVHIPFGSVKPSAPGAADQMWDLVDRSCEVFPQERIAQRMKSLQLSTVFKVLTKVQSCDPRATSHYRGKKWTALEIDLDVSKLTPVTLHALLS